MVTRVAVCVPAGGRISIGPGSLSRRWSIADQISEHNLTGLPGSSKRFERRAGDLNGGPVLMDRSPGGYEARIALKAWTAAARITDHEREAVAGRIPDLDVLDRSDDATEL